MHGGYIPPLIVFDCLPTTWRFFYSRLKKCNGLEVKNSRSQLKGNVIKGNPSKAVQRTHLLMKGSTRQDNRFIVDRKFTLTILTF